MKLLELFALSGLFNFIFALFWGLIVFFKNSEENINKIFLLLSLLYSILWLLRYYFWLSKNNDINLNNQTFEKFFEYKLKNERAKFRFLGQIL